MSNPAFPPVPPLGDGDVDLEADDTPTREVDGDAVLDPDADDAQVDSAEADRIASGADDALTDE